MPQISVIVPVYKVEPYLRRCVDSILGQSFFDLELILVDDGSPDSCPVICDEYAAKYERVHVIHQENRGLAAARNAGIDWAFANSDSQWLSFVDSDDWIHKQMFELLLRANSGANSDICAVEHQVIKKTSEAFDKRLELSNIETTTCSPDDVYLIHSVNPATAWGKLFRKECFSTIRFPFQKLHEDAFILYKLLFAAKTVTVLHTKLYYYWVNPNSITHAAWTPKRLDEFKACEEQLDFYHREGHLNAYRREIVCYLWVMREQMDLIKSMGNYMHEYRKIKTKLRKAIWKYKNDLPLIMPEHAWAYEAAYPISMKLYWWAEAIGKKLVSRRTK